MIQVGTRCYNSAEISTEHLLGLVQVGNKSQDFTFNTTQATLASEFSLFLLNCTLQYNPSTMEWNSQRKASSPLCTATQEASSHCTWNKQHWRSLLASGDCNLPPIRPSAHKRVVWPWSRSGENLFPQQKRRSALLRNMWMKHSKGWINKNILLADLRQDNLATYFWRNLNLQLLLEFLQHYQLNPQVNK